MAETINLQFNESITRESTRSFIEMLCKKIDEKPSASEFILSISSPGGDVELAIEIYNFLRSLNCRIITVNTSVVNSAAILIYLAGDIRLCNPASSFYVHAVTKSLSGSFTYFDLQREVSELKVNTSKIASLLERHTFRRASYWRSLMRQGVIIPVKKAIALGLAHESAIQ